MSRAPPQRHWRSYGNDPLPTGAEALDEPFAAFPSWFMRVTCERCGQERMFNEAHSSTAHHADPRHHREDAPRRLRRQGREGGAAHRHRGRQQLGRCARIVLRGGLSAGDRHARQFRDRSCAVRQKWGAAWGESDGPSLRVLGNGRTSERQVVRREVSSHSSRNGS